MERQNNEIQLEFQMTKGELAEYCVNVTVKEIWSQKLVVAVFVMFLLAGVGKGLLTADESGVRLRRRSSRRR